MKRFNKTFPELLMERIHHHRIKMENAMLLAGCILTLSEDENDDAEAVWSYANSQEPCFVHFNLTEPLLFCV